MPTTTSSAAGATVGNNILRRLTSGEHDVKLKALRELKNQIIGNRTKKLSFLELGAVPAVAGILSEAVSAVGVADNDDNDRIAKDIIVQSAAVLGSFACGFEAGVQAVLDVGAFPNLLRLLSYTDEKLKFQIFDLFLALLIHNF